jgi:signal peptidase I
MTQTPTSVPASPPAGADAALSPELEQVRATVDALHNAAALLQSAIDHRHAVAAEMQRVEQSLAASQSELARAEGKVAQTRAEQAGVMAELDTMVQAALNRRTAVLNEINELERSRDMLALQAKQPAPALAMDRPSRSPMPPLPSARTWLTMFLAAILVGMAVLVTPVSQLVGGLQLLAVMSGSMEPVIQVGGIVGVRPVPVGELQVGDVITFVNQASPDMPITHRIVSLDNRGGQTIISTKGDANDAVDAVTTTPNRSVGRVEFTAPWLGYVMVWLASPIAKVAIVLISVIGFALPSMGLPFRRRSQPVPAEDSSYDALAKELRALLPNTS